MAANLASFQSAVQLVSGANLAIFALPTLGRPEMEVEVRRWNAVVTRATAALPPIDLVARRGRSEFQREMAAIYQRVRRAKACSLYVSLLSGLYLVWMSCCPDDAPDRVTVLMLLLGLLPAAWLLLCNFNANIEIAASRKKRSAVNLGFTT